MVTVEGHEKLCRLVNACRQGADNTTPMSLVQEMIDKIPEEIWKDTSATILDPAAGTGTFLVAAYWKMIQAGDTHENIISNRLFACEINLVYLKIIKDKLGIKNIYDKDFLQLDLHMKFDVVIGNPPYQDSLRSTVKLWPKFLLRGAEILKHSGFMVMVFPNVWINRPYSQKGKAATKMFSEKQLRYVKSDPKGEWFDVGETTSYIVLQNIPNTDKTVVEDTLGNKQEVIYSQQKLLQSKTDILINKIIGKMEDEAKENGKLPLHEDVDHNTTKQEKFDSGILSEVCREGDVEIYWSSIQKFYTNKSNVDPRWRVIMNISGYYFRDDLPDKYIRIDRGVGTTTNSKSILCETEQQAKNVYSYLTSRLYRMANGTQKTSGFNAYVFRLPQLSKDVEWTDEKLYSYFNLTEEEINLVETINFKD